MRRLVLLLALLGWTLSAAAQTTPKITLVWSMPPLTGGQAVHHYQVQRCTVQPPALTCTPQDLKGATPATPSYTDTAVTPALTYGYTVTACDASAPPLCSPPSAPVYGMTGAPPLTTVWPPLIELIAPIASITADSQELAMQNNAATQATDNQLATLWHTPWSGTPGLPHWLLLRLGPPDQDVQWQTIGLRYIPRQDGALNGVLLGYRVEVSVDGVTWTLVSSGTWAADQTIKTVTWTPTLASQVRFTGLSEGSPSGKYGSAAEVQVLVGKGPGP